MDSFYCTKDESFLFGFGSTKAMTSCCDTSRNTFNKLQKVIFFKHKVLQNQPPHRRLQTEVTLLYTNHREGADGRSVNGFFFSERLFFLNKSWLSKILGNMVDQNHAITLTRFNLHLSTVKNHTLPWHQTL